MLQPFSYAMPTRIVFGPGTVARTGEELRSLECHRPILVTDEGVGSLRFFARLRDSITGANLEYEVFDRVPRDPDLRDVDSLVALVRQKGCDSVVAIGGGSVLCAGRGAAVTLPSGGSARELVGVDKVGNDPLPMIAVPTTAGSGSEVSGVIVLSDRESGSIVTIGSPHCFPKLAILDPDALADLPARQAAISGMDALAHGLEALMTTTPNPLSEALAVHACATIFKELPNAALTAESEPKARCLVASTMANMACGNSRLSLGHAMTLPLSARFDIPHGVAAGLLLPHVVRFNLPVAGRRLLPLMRAMGYEPDVDPECILQEIVSLLDDLDFPCCLQTLGVEESALAGMAGQVADSPLSKFNLRKAETSQVLSIYQAAFSAGRDRVVW
ncbi:MAG: iron-containing alcohol dehydrogenase [Deltaproteobacteria bacterium]|nr:iron-containing alcohol dehydrogenase [Deltaproteobacteria bacterium]MBW2120613.1 iron-containing alcohol dehydrogenase [Deltaproteobacteria bacterium]